MVSLKVLERRGITEASLKAKFTAKTKDPKTKKLLDLIQSRIINGRTQNLSTYRNYWAIDAGYNASFSQTEAIITQLFLNRNVDAKTACATCEQWGLSTEKLFYDHVNQDGTKQKRLKIQNFYNILVPLIKAYVTIRRAKIFNDRNTYPLFKYEPISFTSENRALCEVVTDMTQRMSTDFGYAQYLNQNILQTLLYGFCLQFAKEPWYTEYQEVEESEYTVVAGDSLRKIADKFNVTTAQLKKLNPNLIASGRVKLTVGQTITIPERETCVKEGLRYETPHPTRCFFDLATPTNTINTDTGVSFAGYWRVMKYGELEAGPFWNKDSIPFGANNWFEWGGARAFWEEVYPCNMRFPDSAVFGGGMVGPVANMRERRLIYNISNDFDTPVFVTNLVMKINPKTYGLGDYDHDVWFQFLVANDNTVLWAGAIPYNPLLYTGYDSDNYRWPNASMALEILPFQIQMGNILSQILFTVKQSLYKAVWYDDQQLDESVIQEMENKGDGFAGIRFIKYDSQKSRAAQTNPKDSFIPMEFQQHGTAELQQQIPVLIDVLERLLGMSSAEVGSPATHEQTAQEVRVIASNTSIRVDFTGSFVDDMIHAWKRQLYEAQLTYLDDEFMSQVSPTPETIAALRKLGFDVPEDTEIQQYGQNKVQVQVSKSKMVLDGFASERDGANRIDNPAVAAVILQGVGVISQNALLAQAVGPGPLLDILTQAMILAGAPADFKLRVDPKASPEMQQQQMQQQIQAMTQQIMQQVEAGIKPLAEAVQQGEQQAQQGAEAIKAILAKLQEMEQQGQQLAAAVAQTAQLAQQTKQEADQTAQSVLEASNMLKTIAAHTGSMPAPMPGQPPVAEPVPPPPGMPPQQPPPMQ